MLTPMGGSFYHPRKDTERPAGMAITASPCAPPCWVVVSFATLNDDQHWIER